jgi:hypothetical protein
VHSTAAHAQICVPAVCQTHQPAACCCLSCSLQDCTMTTRLRFHA